MACAELVLPGDFDHSHHGGSGLGSGRAHTVSLYRQELEEVQEVEGGRAGRSAVRCRGGACWKCCKVERRTGRSACATWTGAKHLWLEVLCHRRAGRNACASGFPGIGAGRKITTAGGRAEGGFA